MEIVQVWLVVVGIFLVLGVLIALALRYNRRRREVLKQVPVTDREKREAVELTLRGSLEREPWEDAWREMVVRHRALRTSFAWEDLDHPYQVVHRQSELPVRWEDLSSCGEDEREERLATLRREQKLQPFDLTRPPLQGNKRYRYIHQCRVGHSGNNRWNHIIKGAADREQFDPRSCFIKTVEVWIQAAVFQTQHADALQFIFNRSDVLIDTT